MYEWIKRQFIIVCPFDIEKNPPLVRLLLEWEDLGTGWTGIQRRLVWVAFHGVPLWPGATPEEEEEQKEYFIQFARKEISRLEAKGLWT